MTFENAIKPVSSVLEESNKTKITILILYIIVEFVSVYFLIEALRGAILSIMVQGIITSVFIFEIVFYKLMQMFLKQKFPKELLVTAVLGIVGIVFLMIVPDYMPPIFFSNFSLYST